MNRVDFGLLLGAVLELLSAASVIWFISWVLFP